MVGFFDANKDKISNMTIYRQKYNNTPFKMGLIIVYLNKEYIRRVTNDYTGEKEKFVRGNFQSNH